MTTDDVDQLKSQFEANCAAFNRKDIDGYLDGIHPSAWTFQAGNFMPVTALREAAPTIFAVSGPFTVTRWIGGVVVGDAGSVWGEFAYETHGAEGPSTATGSFSAHYVRAEGDWQILFTHYTPAV